MARAHQSTSPMDTFENDTEALKALTIHFVRNKLISPNPANLIWHAHIKVRVLWILLKMIMKHLRL